jgi:hypothetical protein
MAHAWGSGLTGWLAFDSGILVIFALSLAAPIVLVGIAWVRRRQALIMPLVVLIAAVVVAAIIAVLTGAFGEPVSVLNVAPVLAAAVLMRIPDFSRRSATALALLALGWLGGAVAVGVMDRRVAAHVRDVLDGTPADRERLDALNLGRASVGRGDLLIDTLNAPAVMLGRGSARGLHMPQGEAFALAILLGRFDANTVAVPDPHSAAGAQDQLNKVFPKLYRFGAPGYRRIYQNSTWRLFERVEPRLVAND